MREIVAACIFCFVNRAASMAIGRSGTNQPFASSTAWQFEGSWS